MIQIFKNAVKLFNTLRLNFKEGSGITLTTSKNAQTEIVDVEISLSASPTLTTPVLASSTSNTAGALGYDGFCYYGTSNVNNQGIIPIIHFIRQDAAYTLTNTTSVQKIFDGSANGRLTLPVGTYRFTAIVRVTSMDTASGNAQFSLAGTATLGTILFSNWGYDTAPTTGPGTFNGGFAITAATAASMQAASAANSMATNITGTFEVTVAGTIIPSIALVNAAAAVISAGTYFECWSIGSNTVDSSGDWD